MIRIILILILCVPSIVISQSKSDADNLFNNKQWIEAVNSYQKYLKKDKSDSSAWYNMAISKVRLKDYNGAIEAFSKAKDTNFPSNFVYYGLSKTYLLNNDKYNSLKTLEEGAENGLAAYAQLKSDTTFLTIKEDATFNKILEKVKINAYPCLSAKNYRHFDFWLGKWDVFAGGSKVGVNNITMAKGGCAIHEDYITAGNYAGQSINFYDPIDKKWHQHWVGSGGDVFNYIETNKADGMLQFESKFMNAQGQISLSRLTFTLNEDGTVRQLFENSTDQGKTWTSAFDGLYKKIN